MTRKPVKKAPSVTPKPLYPVEGTSDTPSVEDQLAVALRANQALVGLLKALASDLSAIRDAIVRGVGNG